MCKRLELLPLTSAPFQQPALTILDTLWPYHRRLLDVGDVRSHSPFVELVLATSNIQCRVLRADLAQGSHQQLPLTSFSI